MLPSKIFELTLDFLYKNRIKYNTLAIENKNGSSFNFDCTNAYGTIILNLKTDLIKNVSNIIIENKLLCSNDIICNLCNSFFGNINDEYKSTFIQNLTTNINNYPECVKQIIIDYCNIFLNDNYKINNTTSHELLVAYFSKLFIPIFYIFTKDNENSLTYINELNTITRVFGFEYTKGIHYNTYYHNFIEKLIKPKTIEFFKIIKFLENYNNTYLKTKVESKSITIIDTKIKPQIQKKKKNTKEKIPSAVRKIVWNTYIGSDNLRGKCLCCNFEDITQNNFECGHIKSEKNGGEVNVENLRPICSSCNKSISSNDMDTFMIRYKIKKPHNWNGIII